MPDAKQTTLALLDDLFADYEPRDFAVRLWDGTTWGEPTRFTLAPAHPGALRAMLLPPSQLTLAEAYVYGDFDIEGDIHAIFPLADHLLVGRFGRRERLGLARRLL